MNILKKLFSRSSNTKADTSAKSKQNHSFNQEYDLYNNQRIDDFKKRYNLTTIEGIRAIPVQEAKRYPDGGRSVVYMPEQILNRQATEYKKDGKFDLAIECLKKANEIYPYSFYNYKRDDYERVVRLMIDAKRFGEAKTEHTRLDSLYGTGEKELYELQQLSEDKKEYQQTIIEPYKAENKEREQYYWLLENASSVVPKSFAGYRRMKKQNTENYKKIVYEVSNRGFNVDNLTFWG
jgi:hypothetical protein